MKVEKIAVQDLYTLTALFDYKDINSMISECTHDIHNGIIDIFVLYDDTDLIGELHVMYESEDRHYAIRGKRAYLFAYRIHKDYQGMGYGQYLLKSVIELLKESGYSEFTVGVEDDNLRANHIYHSLGFNKLVLRKQEEYQGDKYEYNLYLMK